MLIGFYVLVGPSNPQIRSLIFFAEHSIYKNCNDNRLRDILDARVKKLLKVVLVILAIYISASISFVLLPVYFIINGERILITSAMLPFTDYDTWGYYLSVLNSAFWAAATTWFNVASEITFALIINNLWSAVDVIKFSFEETDKTYRKDRNRKEQAKAFRNCLIQIQDFDRYIL